jgi:hypothetical protein
MGEIMFEFRTVNEEKTTQVGRMMHNSFDSKEFKRLICLDGT